jgi:hypothetical protein
MIEAIERFSPAELIHGVPVIVISLEDQETRRELMLERGLPEAWVKNYFPAIDMRGVEKEQYAADNEELFVVSLGSNRNFLGAELGCAMSHRQAAAWFAASGHYMALVLEDDVLPQGSDWLSQAIATADALVPYARDGAAFVCLLGARSDQTDAALRRRVTWSGAVPEGPQLFEHVDPERKLWRAHAYFISRGAAERSRDKETRILTLADDWGARRKLGLIDALFYTQPTLMAQDDDGPSTIDPQQHRQRVSRLPSKRPNLLLRITRSLHFRIMMARARCRARFPRRLPSPE